MVESVSRALSMVGVQMPYILGTGDYRPSADADVPWTVRDGRAGSDCAGFALCWAHKLKRHRPGFNKGPWASVSDDINCNSAIEDAQHNRELYEIADRPQLGDCIAYPTIRLAGKTFIGHVCIIIGVTRCLEWDAKNPDYSLLDVAHCHGPNGRKPAVTLTDGSIWNRHDELWPKPYHRSQLIRVK